MAGKGPKKKDSKEAAAITDERARKKPPIPLWVEWNDQEIANEKWDNGKMQKDRGRSPTSAASSFEDLEGKIDLPLSLKGRVHSWKRPYEIFNDKVPVIVSPECAYEPVIDLLTPNEHIIDSQLMRHIISILTSLHQVFGFTNEPDAVSSSIKLKQSLSKDIKDLKVEKTKKESEPFEELGWKAWDQIWPKEGSKGNLLPSCNPIGKYAVKIFWMGCYRKIYVDDTIPCDENLKPLLPMTIRGNELWCALLTKALIKVASLDYYGGSSNSEFGDMNVIHCLTGWMPESIPLNIKDPVKIWDLLFNILPHWNLPQPPKRNDESNQANALDELVSSKADLLQKDSKERGKKDDKGKEEKRVKTSDRAERELKGTKEKPFTPTLNKATEQPTPDYIVYATFSNPPCGQCKISDLKTMANISEKLRQFGMCQSYSHPVLMTSIRICPLFPPPQPLQIPKWKLIRQKKKREVVEPKCLPIPEEKDTKFLELQSIFLKSNLNTSSSDLNDSLTKFEKTKLTKQISSICEEEQDDIENTAINENIIINLDEQEISQTDVELKEVLASESEAMKKVQPSSISSQGSQTVLPKNTKGAKSKQDLRKSIQKSGKSGNTTPSQHSINDLGSVGDVEIAEGGEAGITRNSSAVYDDIEKERNVWIDFEEFLQCFSMLWIYHKPKKNVKSITDIKNLDPKSEKSRKSNGQNNLSCPLSGVISCVSSDLAPPFLLVDCIKDAEIIVLFSSFSRWFDPNIDLKLMKDGMNSVKPLLTPVPGTLIIERYYWKRFVTASPLLRLSTSGVKAAALVLPPGRHVLRFMINAPLGYHISLSSGQHFVFDDEHMVMQYLRKESERYIAHSVDVLKNLKMISQSFSDKSIPKDYRFVIGTEGQSGNLRHEHFEILHESFAKTLKSEIEENFNVSMRFALNALKYESYLHLKKISHASKQLKSKSLISVSNPPSANISKRNCSMSNTLALPVRNKNDIAAAKIQSTFKGFMLRKLKRAHILGTPENYITVENLTKVWSYIATNMESFATKVYNRMFDANPALCELFPFHSDEWNKVTFADYNGSFSESTSTSWFIICREIFHVIESNFILAKFYCNITSYLKVINNDTGEELKTLFSKFIPQELHTNKHGYTFVAFGSNQGNDSATSKFQLRIIGKKDPLPICAKEGTVSTHFFTKEIRDYYLPNRYNRIFRHSVKVTEDILTTLQFHTSKEDVYVRLQVLDNEEVIFSCKGKGFLMIPALILYKDRFAPTDESKNSPRPGSRDGSANSGIKATNTKSHNNSKKPLSPDKGKKKSMQFIDLNNEEAEVLEDQIHMYIVEAFVLDSSWPLTKREWDFVENLKNSDKLDNDNSSDQLKIELTSRGSAGKSRKSNAGKESRHNRSRPLSQSQNLFDVTKANWTLRFIIDSNMEHAVELKRDTQRDDEVKAMKAAWELADPGRASKAQLSREKYMETHAIRVAFNVGNTDVESHTDDDGMASEKCPEDVVNHTEGGTDSPEASEADTGELFLEPLAKENQPTLKTFDISPYIKSTGKAILLDKSEEDRRQYILQEQFSNFLQSRDALLQKREDCRISRNLEKEKLLADYENMQIQLDDARHELYAKREMYRNKFIPKPEAESEADLEKKKQTPSPKLKPSKSRMKKK